MRIVGGKFKGLHLATPSDQATRPTSDRVREAVFNILAHGIAGLELDDARVLDLFAGTGALGFEALSRGARYCQFVDESAEAPLLGLGFSLRLVRSLARNVGGDLRFYNEALILVLPAVSDGQSGYRNEERE